MTPGAYRVEVKANGFVAIDVNEVAIADGQSTELPTQSLLKGAHISGRRLRPRQRDRPGASVQLSPADANELADGRTTRADVAGRFVIENVERAHTVSPPRARATIPTIPSW